MIVGAIGGEIDIAIHDVVRLRRDGCCDVNRRYIFTNKSNKTLRFSWHGREVFWSRPEDASVAPPAVMLSSGDEIEWQIPTQSLAAEESLATHVICKTRNAVTFNPLVIRAKYVPDCVCRYSFELHPPFPGFRFTTPSIDANAVALVEEISGVLRAPESIWASPNRRVDLAIGFPPRTVCMTRLMRVYQKAAQSRNDALLGDYVCLLIPHLLRDSIGYIEALASAGMKSDDTFIVGIPYSAKSEAVSALWERGYKNLWIPTRYPFTEELNDAVTAAWGRASEAGKRVLVIEDGGYIGRLIHVDRRELLANCVGIVEQTRNGIWEYPPGGPSLPVVNVAESKLKLDRESPLIGGVVVRTAESLLARYGFRIENYRALVVGYGSTGACVAQTLKQRGLEVCVYDENPDRRGRAALEDFDVATNLQAGLSDRSLIIGCTGRVPFGFEEIAQLKHAAVFISASSKNRELDYQSLEELTVGERQIDGVGVEISLVNGRKILLLADGRPINFVDESVPDEDIAFIGALLYRAALYLVTDCAGRDGGFYDVPLEIQEEVERRADALKQA